MLCCLLLAGIPRKNSKNGPDQTPLPPQEPPPQDSDSDLEYDDVIGVLDMHNSERMGVITPRSKPQSLHPDGLTRGGHFPPSPTCSTPSSEVASPPAVLPKPIGKTRGAVPNITPAIPIRRSKTCLKNSRTLVDILLSLLYILRLAKVRSTTRHHGTH